MDGYHPLILTTPRNESFLEEKGDLLSADCSLSPICSISNEEFDSKVVLKNMCFGVS